PPERRAVVDEAGAQPVEPGMEPMPSLERTAVERLATDQRASATPVPPVLHLRDRAPAGTALGREPVEPVAPSLDAEARVEATHRPVEHRARAPRVCQSRTEARATTGLVEEHQPEPGDRGHGVNLADWSGTPVPVPSAARVSCCAARAGGRCS